MYAVLTVAFVAAAAAAGVLWDGGFERLPRAVFTVLAALAALSALGLDRERTNRALRSPAVWVLAALAVALAISASWTTAEPGDTIRWSMVVASYAALVVAAAAIAAQPGGRVIVVSIVSAVALTAGLLGLIGVGLRVEPYALHLGGVWRPAGPTEYPPALALLQVAALPGVLAAMADRRARIALPAAAASALAAAVIALAESRLELVLAVGALLAVPLGLYARDPERRRLAWAGIGVFASAALVAELMLGGTTPDGELGGDVPRLLALFSLLAATPLVWVSVRRGLHSDRLSVGAIVTIAGLFAFAVVSFLALGASTFSESPEGRGTHAAGGAWHGRLELWSAGLDTAMERPLIGAGGEAFLPASLDEQAATPIRYAHSLPLELFVELGVIGLLLVCLLYVACGSAIWRARRLRCAWLLTPAVAAFLIANLFDWPWHLAGVGAIWAIALGGIIGPTPSSDPGLRFGRGPSSRG